MLSVHFLCCYATSYLWLCNVRLCRSSGKTSSSFLASMTPWTLSIPPRWNPLRHFLAAIRQFSSPIRYFRSEHCVAFRGQFGGWFMFVPQSFSRPSVGLCEREVKRGIVFPPSINPTNQSTPWTLSIRNTKIQIHKYKYMYTKYTNKNTKIFFPPSINPTNQSTPWTLSIKYTNIHVHKYTNTKYTNTKCRNTKI